MTLTLRINPNFGSSTYSLADGIGVKNSQFQYASINTSTSADDYAKEFASSQAENSNDQDSVDLTQSSTKNNKLLELSTMQSFISITKSAVDSVADLRNKQYELAKEAETLAVSERRDLINTEIATLETEISRVADEASFNGQNAFSSSVLMATGDNRLIVGIGRVTTADALTIDVSTDSGASSAVTSLANNLKSTLTRSSDLQSAYNKTEEELNSALNQDLEIRKNDPNKLADEYSARKVAVEVTKQLVDPYYLEKHKNDVLETTLDPSRVSALLSED